MVCNVLNFSVAYTTYFHVVTDCEKRQTKQSELIEERSKWNASVPSTRTQQNSPETITRVGNKHNERIFFFFFYSTRSKCFLSLFLSPLQRLFRIHWSAIKDAYFRTAYNIPHEFNVYLSLRTKPGCTSKVRCDYQKCRCFERIVVWLQEFRWLVTVVVFAGQSVRHIDENADGG